MIHSRPGTTAVSVTAVDIATLADLPIRGDKLWERLPSSVAFPDWGVIKKLAADPVLLRKCSAFLAPESIRAIERLAGTR